MVESGGAGGEEMVVDIGGMVVEGGEAAGMIVSFPMARHSIGWGMLTKRMQPEIYTHLVRNDLDDVVGGRVELGDIYV